jgi:hypothetical protein
VGGGNLDPCTTVTPRPVALRLGMAGTSATPIVLVLLEPEPFELFAVPFVAELLPVETVPFALAAL